MRCLGLIVLLLFAGPAWSQTIVASVEPLAKLLRSLYGPEVEVVTLLQANQNPHQLALSPRQVMQVRDADLLVWLGAGVEAPLAPLVAVASSSTASKNAVSGAATTPKVVSTA